MKLAKTQSIIIVDGKEVSKDTVYAFDEKKHTAQTSIEAYEKYKAELETRQSKYDIDRADFLVKEKEFQEWQKTIDIGILALEPYEPEKHDQLLNEKQ